MRPVGAFRVIFGELLGARVGIEPSGPSGEREISNEPSQGPGPHGS